MEEPERSKRLIDICRNPVKSNIIQLLRIYNELSTLELANKLGKSKPTVLRNINELIQVGIIHVNQIENLPGKYPKQTYQLREKEFTIKGQELRPYIYNNPELVLPYNDFRIAIYTQLNGIINSCISYLRKMRNEFEKNLDDPEELLEIARDNLGTIKFEYMTREKTRQVFIEKDAQLRKSKEKRDTNDYLHIQLLLPIKRLIEMEKQKNWVKDGNLWSHYENEK